jgi:hypothetical protein
MNFIKVSARVNNRFYIKIKERTSLLRVIFINKGN